MGCGSGIRLSLRGFVGSVRGRERGDAKITLFGKRLHSLFQGRSSAGATVLDV